MNKYKMYITGNVLARVQRRRSLGHHLLHLLILRLLVLCAPADFEAQSSLLKNELQPQIQIPNALYKSQKKEGERVQIE